ncbi:MAG: hypothetical protein FP814_00250 [Desulfobacterium sp.]|nr:hypothetical protein [Desulfobacterium sp.]MBU3950347.1 hypothetical protein [Pseudomonadota bacterium]MBU4009352.1 hypothetical protein [Pseudomonadota bacterium]MBU4037471.1 hypothetical protein [Pseudomonadota bacterium]
MSGYGVFVVCDECGGIHPMRTRLELKDGPADKKSISDHFAGKALPTNIASLMNSSMICPNTKKTFFQKDNNQVFLIRVA